MTFENIQFDVAAGVARLTLNRPDNLNAFTVEMADELEDAYRRANGDDAVRAIVEGDGDIIAMLVEHIGWDRTGAGAETAVGLCKATTSASSSPSTDKTRPGSRRRSSPMPLRIL